MQEKCPVCATPIEANLLPAHLLDIHKSSPDAAAQAEAGRVPHKCIFCGTTFPTPEQLKSHHATAHQR